MANEPITQTDDLNDADLAARTQAAARADLLQPRVANPWEEEPELPSDHPTGVQFLDKAYTSARGKVNEWEDAANKKVVQPFRQGLDTIGSDLQEAGESGHTKSGGQLTGPARALASGVGTLIKNAPVGSTVRDTALMALTPSLPEGH